MKLDQLRKIIREEVRSAVKDELQEMLNEAVKAASAPSTQEYKAVKQKDLKRTWSTGRMNPGTVPLEEMLNMTRESMTGDDYKNVVNADSSMVKKPNFASRVANEMSVSSGNAPGIDLSSIPGLSKAKAIFDRANEKQAARL